MCAASGWGSVGRGSGAGELAGLRGSGSGEAGARPAGGCAPSRFTPGLRTGQSTSSHSAGGVGSLLETGHLVDFAIRNEQHGGDLHENGCFPIRKRVAPCRNHGPGSIPYWKMDH